MSRYAAAVLAEDLSTAHPGVVAKIVASLHLVGFPVVPDPIARLSTRAPGADSDHDRVVAMANMLYVNPQFLDVARENARRVLERHASQLDAETIRDVDALLRVHGAGQRRPTENIWGD